MISVEEAQEHLPFTVQIPAPLPPGLTLDGVHVNDSSPLDGAALIFEAIDPTATGGIIVLVQQQQPVTRPIYPDHEQVDLQVGSTTVTRVTDVGPSCLATRSYQWASEDLHLMLYAGLVQSTDEAVLLPLLATLLEVAPDEVASLAAPAAGATPIGHPNTESRYCNLPVEEAAEVAGFEVAMAEAIPSVLWLRDIYVEPALFGPESSKTMVVVQRYGNTQQSTGYLELRQGLSAQAVLTMPFIFNDPRAKESPLTIADTDVTHVVGGYPGDTATPATGTAAYGVYSWQVGESFFTLDTRTLLGDSALPVVAIEALIAATIATAEA